MIRSCLAWLVSAPASGQGKTMVTAALARAHVRRGRRVRVFKTGPDFLDPTVLEHACGAPVRQLDLWMGGEDDVRRQLFDAAGEADLILVEGAMGLFDGTPSSADLAWRMRLPVLAVIDGSAMAQTFGAVAHGLATYRPELVVSGVVANRVAGAFHASLLRESLPAHVAWCGALRQSDGPAFPERHLGLVDPAELSDVDRRLDALTNGLDDDATSHLPPIVDFERPPTRVVSARLDGKRIAIARDAAFAFIYAANLDVLRAAGATLDFFSPLAGDALPDCDAVWLPGGYPELHLARLAGNSDLRRDLERHVATGRPLLAECGGLLYALETLRDAQGNEAPMAGLLRGSAIMQPRLVALGLQSVALPEGTLRGHAFHHARAEVDTTPLAMASNPNGGPTTEAVYRRERMTTSFMHFYFPSHPDAAVRLFLP